MKTIINMKKIIITISILLLTPFFAQAGATANRLSGKILLDVERNGEAWYVYPVDNHRYYLGRPNDAFNIMRNLGLGISNENLEKSRLEI